MITTHSPDRQKIPQLTSVYAFGKSAHLIYNLSNQIAFEVLNARGWRMSLSKGPLMAHTRTHSDGLTDPLTEREQEILAGLAEGLTNHEIANWLHLAEKTVRWYNSQIYSKLGVSNRAEAVAQAHALGLLAVRDAGWGSGKHNLLPQATRFVGRQRELDELAALLSDGHTHLVTILAPGGMGKTRLALETARTQIGRFVDGVFFVPLAPLSAVNDIVTAIAEIIGFTFHGEVNPAQQLIDFLKDRAILLVLDNFEHLLAGAPLVAELVQAAPAVRVLTTSLERLNLHAEIVYMLAGLDFPTWETPDDALEYDAVILFVQSAFRTRPDFVLQAEDLDFLARICRLTAGMPLGIELAAGWVDVLSLEQIAAEIQQGIDILETDLRDVPERQRSIRATFEYSWNRLNEDAQTIFGRLSVFRGGFTLAAAQAVAGATARHLRGLAQKAFIQTERGERFAIHELLRQFGADKLVETGELPAIQAKHAAFFADFMQARQSEIFTHQQFDALDRIGADFENVRSAWNVLIEQQAFDELQKFLEGLWLFFDVRSRGQEGVALFETTANILQTLPPSDVTELALARLWARLAWFYNDVGLSEKAKVTAEASIRLLDRHNSPEDLLAAYRSLGVVSIFLRDAENTRRIGEAGYTLALKLGNRSHEAHNLLMLGSAASMFNEDLGNVQPMIEQARTIYEDLGNQWGMMKGYTVEAVSAFWAGDYEQVKHLSVQELALAKALGNAFGIANSTMYLGLAAMWQGDYRQARDLVRQSLRTFWDVGYLLFATAPILCMVQLLMREGKIEPAVEILAVIERYPAHYSLFAVDPDPFGKLREELQAELDAERFAAAWARGQQRELSGLVAELLAENRDKQP
jgi:predicted ATPase/DNA-binding CsgD family transcriptional regulator